MDTIFKFLFEFLKQFFGSIFGGIAKYREAIKELESAIYAA
jgi:hypothetical protein